MLFPSSIPGSCRNSTGKTWGAVHKSRDHFLGGEGVMNWSRLITWGGGVFEMITRSIFYLEKQWKIEIQFEFIRNLFDFSLWNHNSHLGDIHSVLHITVYSCRNENLTGYFQGQFEVFGLNFFRKTLLDFFLETLESFNSRFCRKNYFDVFLTS